METEEDGRPRWSFSQLTTYADCSEKWRLEKQVQPRIPGKPAIWFILGHAVHEAIEKWLNGFRETDIVQDFLDAYDAECEATKEKFPDFSFWMNPGKLSVLEKIAQRRETGVEMVKAFVKDMETTNASWDVMRDSDDGTAWTEVPFDIDLGGIRVIGSIDCVDENGEGVDWKTGGSDMSKSMQHGLYGYVLRGLGIKNTHGRFFYTGKISDSRKSWGFSHPYDTTRYDEKYLTDVFTAAQRGVEAGVFIPNPGKNCDLCGVKKYCREMGWAPIPLDWESVEEPWWVDTSA